ncbi:asparaginase [bacterium]|nr:asparaginase [bacterium]
MKLLEYYRDGLIEEEHYGFITVKTPTETKHIGEDNGYPFFLRSCAKPLQASLLCDYGLDRELSLEQIAVCCASHAGEQCHVMVVRSVLEKFGLSEKMLQCGEHEPVSFSAQKELILKGEKAGQIHNNCSGKHAMMLALCKKNGWSLDNYYELEHPLQQSIKSKINDLCEVTEIYPITTDGCGVPIFSMPLENILKGYLNLFFDDKYVKIKEAFQNCPYLIGGENRLDTAVMMKNPHLISKVGAGGLCVVVNLEEKSAFVVKIADCDMRARAICVIKLLKDFGWIKEETDFMKIQNSTDILTIKGLKVGEVKACF